jgi:hypothetical protein
MGNTAEKERRLWTLGFLGFQGFALDEPWLLLNFCLFALFSFFRHLREELKYLGILGIVGLVVAILGVAGLIEV